MSEIFLLVDSDTVEFFRFGIGADGALLPGSASFVPSATTVITDMMYRECETLQAVTFFCTDTYTNSSNKGKTIRQMSNGPMR